MRNSLVEGNVDLRKPARGVKDGCDEHQGMATWFFTSITWSTCLGKLSPPCG